MTGQKTRIRTPAKGTRVGYTSRPRGRCPMAKTLASQAKDGGSIPLARSSWPQAQGATTPTPLEWVSMRTFLVLVILALALGVTSQAHAASVAYVDNGEVWVSSLDGTQKVRLAAPVLNTSGATEKWLDVAAADSGRIVAVRNEPGKTARLSWFKVWEPDGTSTVEGPLNALGGWALYAYPLSLDLTADGRHMAYGYSLSGFCCPTSFARGTYVRPVTNSPLEPISISGEQDPTIFGDRVIAHTGRTIDVQDVGSTYGPDFTPWLDVSGIAPLDLRRTDVAANGRLAVIGGELWDGGTQTVGKIGVLSIQGVDQGPVGPVDCFVPASGVAKDPSVSPDARTVAWTDGQGLKVAGAPTSAADPWEMTSPAVVLSPPGEHAAIGGADIAAFLPPTPPPAGGGTGGAGGSGGSGGPPAAGGTGGAGGAGAPAAKLPAKITTKALGAGLSVKVTVPGAGKVTLTATVPAKAMSRRGKPVLIGAGSAIAKGAGTVTVKLKLNSAARRRLKQLRGAKLTLRCVQNGRSTTKTVTLR